ncbi:MAG: hypothetical protein ACPG8W_03880 [Candidatus Promineifilaceae bacterium]
MNGSASVNRFKWFVLLFVSALLALLLFFGREGLSRFDSAASDPVEETESVAQMPEADPTQEEVDAVEATQTSTETPQTMPAIARPTIDSAGYRPEGNGQVLTLGGTADEQCNVRIYLDDEEVTPVNRSAESWSVDVPVPDIGAFEVKVDCLVDDKLFDSNARELQINAPETTEAAPTEASASDAGEVTEDAVNGEETAVDESAENTQAETDAAESADPATDESGADTAEDGEAATATKETAEETTNEQDVVITGELSDLRFANEMADWNVGYLLVRGRGTPGASVAVIFANGGGTVESATLVNAEGNWAVRGFLEQPGEYLVTARSGENSADIGSVTVAENIQYGGPGLCTFNRTPPFGAVEGNQYTVADCEFFGLIAKRLAVSIAELRAANPQIFNFNLIKAGDVLNIPSLP